MPCVAITKVSSSVSQKEKKPVTDTVVESAKLSYLGILQFLEDVNFHQSFLNLEDVVVYLLLSFEWLRIQKGLCFFCLHHF